MQLTDDVFFCYKTCIQRVSNAVEDLRAITSGLFQQDFISSGVLGTIGTTSSTWTTLFTS